MLNLFGEPCDYSFKKPVDKERLNWENRFQRWSNRKSQIGTTSLGKCGYGSMCDYCEDNTYGRPCVRALNSMLRDKYLEIKYEDADFEKIWQGTYFKGE